MKRRLIGILVAGVGILHVTMTILYLSPPNLLKLTTERWVHAYMAPLFYQDWHLFSPNPGISSTELWIRCKVAGGEWSSWLAPFEEIQSAHYRNRFTGRGKLLYVYRGIGSRLHERYDELAQSCRKHCGPGDLLREVKREPEYAVAARFASDYCAAVTHAPAPLTLYELKTINLTPKKFSDRRTAGKWGSVKERNYGKGTGRQL